MKPPADKVYHGDLTLDEIRDNPSGRDAKHLNEEFLTFKNSGAEPLDISGWTVENEAGDVFRFPERTTVKPDARVTLHSGPGRHTDSEFYWQSDRPMWKNDGDTVVVTDEDGTVRIRESYNE